MLPLGEACWDDVYSVPCDRVRSRADALMAMQRAFANKQPCMTREEAEQAARYPAQLDIPGALKGRALRLAQTGLVAELQSREIQMRQQFGFNSFGRGMQHKIGVASATAEDVRIWDMLSAKLQSALEKARTGAFRAVVSSAPPQDWVRLEVAADPVAAGVVGAAVARAGVVTAAATEGGVDGSGEAGGGAAADVDGRGCGGAASAAAAAGLGRVDGVSGADGTGVALSAEAAVDGGRLVHTVHRHGFTVGNGEAVCTAPSKPLLSPGYVRGAPGEEDALVLNVTCSSSWEGSPDDSSSSLTMSVGRKGGRDRAGGTATGEYQKDCRAALELAYEQAAVGLVDAKDISFQLEGDSVAAEGIAKVVVGLLSQHPKVQSLPAGIDMAAAFVAVMGDEVPSADCRKDEGRYPKAPFRIKRKVLGNHVEFYGVSAVEACVKMDLALLQVLQDPVGYSLERYLPGDDGQQWLEHQAEYQESLQCTVPSVSDVFKGLMEEHQEENAAAVAAWRDSCERLRPAADELVRLPGDPGPGATAETASAYQRACAVVTYLLDSGKSAVPHESLAQGMGRPNSVFKTR